MWILCRFLVKLGWGNTDSPIIKIFVSDLPSQPFLGRHLYFTTFFILAILHRATPFFTAWLFLSGYHIFFVNYIFCRKKKACKKIWDTTFIAYIAFKYCHIFSVELFSLLNSIYIIDTSSTVLHSNTLIKQTLFLNFYQNISRYFWYSSMNLLNFYNQT